MVHPKIATLANQFKLHELKFQNASSYLASKLDSDHNPARLRQNLAQLQTIASRLEELAEQMSVHMPLEELEPFLQISADTSLQILQITGQIENPTTTELTHALHSQSAPAFTAAQLRCDKFPTTPTVTATTTLTQTDSSRSDIQQPSSTVATNREATHILDMTGLELSRHLATVEDTTLRMTPDRHQHNNRGTQPTENSTTVTDLDNVLQQQEPSSFGNSLQPQHSTSTTGSSLIASQQHANLQTIQLPPQLPPLLNKPTYNNHSEQRHLSNSNQHLQPTLDNMLPQLVYTFNYHQPTFDTFVTHNPTYLPTAYEMRPYEPRHLTPAEPLPSHPQEQLPFNQSTGHLFNAMHNHYSFLQPCTKGFCPHQSQATCSTAMDPSHQLIAHAANYSIPPLIPQPTIVEPQMPPPLSTLYMNEFPRQQISQTNFRQSANAVQQCFGTPTVSNNQTVFTTRPQQNANMPTNNSSATQIEPTNAAVTHSHPQVQPPQTSTADANYPPVCIKLPPIQIPKFNGDPLAFHKWVNIFKAMVHSDHSITQTHRRIRILLCLSPLS